MALPALKHPSVASFIGGISIGLTAPYFTDSDSLVIKHLPETFSEQDVRRFLTDAGAIEIKYFGTSGRLGHVAIAKFRNPQTAVLVMQKLHQIKLGKRRLVVEFADDNLTKHLVSENRKLSTTPNIRGSVLDASHSQQLTEFIKEICQSNGHDGQLSQLAEERDRSTMSLASRRSIRYSASAELQVDLKFYGRCINNLTWSHMKGVRSELKYEYPPPDPVTLRNIMYILAECPSLYVQVLHLMNKMNLPVPFGSPRPAPAIFSCDSSGMADAGNEADSSSDSECPVITQITSAKKPRSSLLPQRKRIRLSHFSGETSNPTVASAAVTTANTGNVFEANSLVSRHIYIEAPTTKRLQAISQSSGDEDPGLITGGFALMKPLENPPQPVFSVPVICTEELDKLRMGPEELNGLAPFRNYSPGQPSCKLYVKNIAKSVEEEDLRFIFGRYVDWTNTLDAGSFSIRLMQEGRMKGQAFITLPNQFKAAQALKEVHGCRVKDKAVVVTFARADK